MTHIFDIDHAQKYGVDEAIFIQNLIFWIAKNLANERHSHEGKTWTYNSIPALRILFPYWTEKQLRRIIESLVEKRVILTHQRPTDNVSKVTWFAFADEPTFLKFDLPKRADRSARLGTRSAQMGRSAYGTDILPDISTPELREIGRQANIVEAIYQAYPRKVGKPVALKKIAGAIKEFDPAFVLKRTQEFAATWEGQNHDFCPHPATWFFQHRFNDDPSTWKRNNGTHQQGTRQSHDRREGTYNRDIPVGTYARFVEDQQALPPVPDVQRPGA